ncbi:hypothetical protein [Apilactobacillus micheneri]|uniref:hypothetical protein n=1 Tax=Apilactobacillus micheneri TaxID=1899430 RepID=UPI000D506B72|nr:hypothetical protein [Apilactobacillus micheneri]GAY79426.1 hypothetical protein NBRC113063_00261 [Apilactobacillus micheneri]
MKVKSMFRKMNQQNLFFCLAFIALICIFNLIFSRFSKNSLLNLINVLPGFLDFCLIGLLSRNYASFKLSIQNGISRKRFWHSKTVLIISSAFFANLFGFIITMMFYLFDKSKLNSFYIDNYFHFFNSYIINFIFMFITGFCMMLFLLLLFNTWGSLMSLFNHIVKIIIYLILFSLMISFFIGITHEGFYEYFVNLMDNMHVESIFKFLSGFNTIDIDKRHLLSNANPINAISTLFVSSLILGCINYQVTKFQQVNR